MAGFVADLRLRGPSSRPHQPSSCRADALAAPLLGVVGSAPALHSLSVAWLGLGVGSGIGLGSGLGLGLGLVLGLGLGRGY